MRRFVKQDSRGRTERMRRGPPGCHADPCSWTSFSASREHGSPRRCWCDCQGRRGVLGASLRRFVRRSAPHGSGPYGSGKDESEGDLDVGRDSPIGPYGPGPQAALRQTGFVVREGRTCRRRGPPAVTQTLALGLRSRRSSGEHGIASSLLGVTAQGRRVECSVRACDASFDEGPYGSGPYGLKDESG